MTIAADPGIMKIIIFTVVGALFGGALWSYRGSHGWGGESGVLNWGFLMTMYLVMVSGGPAGTSPLQTALAGMAMTLTTPAWGTLNKQICGVIDSNGENKVSVRPSSGVAMMLLLGFGTPAVFGLILGNIFCGTPWTLKEYIVIIAVYYAVFFICEATVSHPIVKLIQPPGAEAFERGLRDNGISGSAYKAFMAHFDKMSWAKKIPGGRNYFTEVAVVSKAIASAACLTVTGLCLGETGSARTGAFVCASFAVGITAADVFFLLADKGLIDNQKVPAWSSWEYFTGFLAGGAITLYILLNGNTAKAAYSPAVLPPRIYAFIVWLAGYCFMFAYNILRPLAMRFDGNRFRKPVVAAASAVTAAVLIITGATRGFDMSGIPVTTYASAGLLAVFVIQTLLYFFAPGYDRGKKYGAAYNMNFVGITDAVSAVVCAAAVTVFLVK